MKPGQRNIGPRPGLVNSRPGPEADSAHGRAHAALARRRRRPAIALLDQTRLPAEEKVVTCRSVAELIDAIRRLVIRGAPALGLAGAFGVALAAYRGEDVAAAARALAAARPTAVNLAWGTGRALAAYQAAGQPTGPGTERQCADAALATARAIEAEEAAASAAMAAHGLPLDTGRRPGADALQHRGAGVLG